MTGLNVGWAREQLSEFLSLTERVAIPSSPGLLVSGTRYRGSELQIAGLAHVVEQILDRVLPQWRQQAPEPSGSGAARRWSSLRDTAARAGAQLERQKELDEKLGDGAPVLDAGKLHPWVWEAARSLWRSGHYVEAVQAGAVTVNAETQRKVGRRDVSESALFQQVFSLGPPTPGKARLHVVPEDLGATFKNRQRGAAALGEALYAGIRNPAAHEAQTELQEHHALEQLAAFSLLARWVDGSTRHE